MGGKDQSGGGATPFESMPHEQMLAWLDQAESGAVQAAADSLAAAAGKIRSIAEELKKRPERVVWEGEGNKAFVEWGASLSNASLRLANYSDEASKWLGRASEAITEAQSAIPREKGPIASAVMPPSPLEPIPEMNRLEAAAQMRRLAQSYQQSQTQMAKLELPTFQPPPGRFVPDGGGYGSTQDLARTGSDDRSIASGGGTYEPSAQSGGSRATSGVSGVSSAGFAPVERPAAMEIDSVATLPPTPAAPGAPDKSLPVGRQDGTGLPVTGTIPPAFTGRTGTPGPGVAGGRSVPGARSPLLPGQSPAGTGPTGRPPQNNGISGGRPVPTSSGRPSGGIPRGAVIGGEQNQGRTPMGRGIGGGMGGIMGGGQSGITGGRRLASEAGGVVGGRPSQPGTRTGRPFTPGGSGLVRGAAADGGARSGQTAVPPGSRRGASRRGDDTNGERPDYLTEDEETWQQGRRRVVPPVID